MVIFGIIALRYLFESSYCFSFEQLELIEDLDVSNFIEFLFFVFHSIFDENFNCWLWRCKKEEQQGGERVQKEVLEITFTVFVAYIPDKIKICVIVCTFYLFEGLHYNFIALIVAVGEQK